MTEPKPGPEWIGSKIKALWRVLSGQSARYDIGPIEVGRSKTADVLAQLGGPESITEMGGSFGTGIEWTWFVPCRVFVRVDFDQNGCVTGKYMKTYN